jgi:hypothetical protein
MTSIETRASWVVAFTALGVMAIAYGAPFGASMIGVGLVMSTGSGAWRLWVGHGLFIGLPGNAGINAPLYVYVSRWFDRRGTALALISSGQ